MKRIRLISVEEHPVNVVTSRLNERVSSITMTCNQFDTREEIDLFLQELTTFPNAHKLVLTGNEYNVSCSDKHYLFKSLVQLPQFNSFTLDDVTDYPLYRTVMDTIRFTTNHDPGFFFSSARIQASKREIIKYVYSGRS
jgi:hypothetical protein